MEINLFSREIELIKVSDNSLQFAPDYTGRAVLQDNKAYFINSTDGFLICLHEIFHYYIYRAGFDNLTSFSKENICDMFATCIDQLMLENGEDIIERIKQFVDNDTIDVEELLFGEEENTVREDKEEPA